MSVQTLLEEEYNDSKKMTPISTSAQSDDISVGINTPPYSSWKTPWREEAARDRKRKELRQRSRSSLLPASHTVSGS
ncbi:hypothetical protein F2P79_013316 [Pimephales promelas]|nr:hypothetical protein F2P79_013316 [Pimephales promelas]